MLVLIINYMEIATPFIGNNSNSLAKESFNEEQNIVETTPDLNVTQQN